MPPPSWQLPFPRRAANKPPRPQQTGEPPHMQPPSSTTSLPRTPSRATNPPAPTTPQPSPRRNRRRSCSSLLQINHNRMGSLHFKFVQHFFRSRPRGISAHTHPHLVARLFGVGMQSLLDQFFPPT